MLETMESVPAGPWLAHAIDEIDPKGLSDWDLPAYRGRARECRRGPPHVSRTALRSWRAARVGSAPTRKSRSRYANRSVRRNGASSTRGGCGGCCPRRGGCIRRTLTRLDPAGAQDRARKAREQADVTLLPGEDGMSTVVVDAPVEHALPVKSAADAYAATAKAGGDTRRIGVLRAEGLARICTDYLTGATTTGAAPRAGGRPIEIGIVIDSTPHSATHVCARARIARQPP